MGSNYGYHNDVVTGLDGKVVLSHIPVDSYEITEIRTGPVRYWR